MSPTIVLTLDDAGTPPSLLAVDLQSRTPATIPLAPHGRLTGALALDDDRVIAGVYDEASQQTTVVGVTLAAHAVTSLGKVAGDAKVQTLTPDGTAVVGLHMTAFRPVAVVRIALPTAWHGAAASLANTRRIVWLGRRATEPEPEPLVIAMSASPRDQQLTWQTTAATLSPYIALLLDQSQEQIFAVDFFQQTVTRVSAASGRVVQTVRFGTIPTKRPPCAALLSPAGERLYLLANRSASEGTGILIYEPSSLRPLAHWFAAESQFACLGQSADGRLLYLLTSPGELRVVTAAPGELIHAVSLGHSALGLRFVPRPAL